MKWYNWQDVPFEEYIHQEHFRVPGVIVQHMYIPSIWHHVKSIGGERDTMTHLMMVCKSIGEGNYCITPKEE